MAAAVQPKDWLDWHSARLSQDHAVRLACFCAAVLPGDKQFADLVAEQIKIELLGLALHGRRTMERHNKKSATLGSDPLWPTSTVESNAANNLWEIFGRLIHAESIEIGWEEPDLTSNPYSASGRNHHFAGHVVISKADVNDKFSIGAIVAAYLGSVLNQLPT